MNRMIYRPAGCRALALGLLAGACLFPSASIAAGDTFLHARPAAEAVGLDRIHVAQADATAQSGTPVTFSAEQADRGEEDYNDDCAECHGDDLRGGLIGGPPLRGLSFEEKFLNGAPASGLFMFMSTLMPPNAPGRFSPNVYADIMAYILKENGFQAGGAELPSEIEALDNLILEK
jgi:mono/diheme cytochrome c family protein